MYFQVVIPGLHLTLGIFLKLFKLFDQEVRRLDFRLGRLDQEEDVVEQEIKDVLNELFFIEDKISNFEESLSTCIVRTDLYLYDISQLEDEDTEGRKELEETFQTHRVFHILS